MAINTQLVCTTGVSRRVDNCSFEPRPVKMFFAGLFLVSQLVALTYAQGGTYGTTFAIAIPPIRESSKIPGDVGYCRLIINSLVQTEVTITTFERPEDRRTLTPKDTLNYDDLPCDNYRVGSGIETKVVFVNATQPVSVIVSNSDPDGNMDAFTAYPVDASISNEYFISGYENVGVSGETIADCGFPNDTSSFYTIVNPSRGNNTVRIYRPGRYGTPFETIVLGDLETYTNITLVENYRDVKGDFNGYYFEAESSIFLFAGGLCTDATFDASDVEGATTSAMPPISRWETGDHYSYDLRVITPGGAIEDNPYRVQIMSAEDDNLIQIGTTLSRTLNRAETATFQLQSSFNNFNCEKPCLVTQFSENRDQETGVFSMQVTPLSLYNTITGFTSVRPGGTVNNFVRIISPANRTAVQSAITYTNLFAPAGVLDWDCTFEPFPACELLGAVQLDQFQVLIESVDPDVLFTAITYWSGNRGRGGGLNTGLGPRP